MESPLVSIIMPAYNAGSYISEAIGSVRAGTFADWELIVVDDGSTDETADLVRRHSEEDHRVRLIQQANAGVSCARNTGLDVVRGKYFTFLDADDLQSAGKIAALLETLKKHPEADIAFGRHVIMDEDGSNPHDSGAYSPPRELLGGREMFELLLRKGYFFRIDAALFPDVVRRDFRFPPGLAPGGDLRFLLDIASRFSFAACREQCVSLRRGHESITIRQAHKNYENEKGSVLGALVREGCSWKDRRRHLSNLHMRFAKRHLGRADGKSLKHAALAMIHNPLSSYPAKHVLLDMLLGWHAKREDAAQSRRSRR